MAKGKKAAKELSLEEKLQQAFVPIEEQPYLISENWCWTKIGILSSLHRGVSYKKEDAHAIKENDDCLIMRGGNIGEGYIITDADNVYINKSLVDESQLVCQNDIIIVASTGSTKVIGRAGISAMDYKDVSFGAFLILVRPADKFNPKYLGFFFQSDDYRNQIRNLASGVNINNIRSDYITNMPIPVPPLAEQQRIVDRIESLFAKLDEVKEKAQAVVDSFELRKSAILHRAFTGGLTEQWRKEHGGSDSDWYVTQFNNVAEIKSNLVEPADYQDFPHIAPDNIEKRTGNLLEYHTIAEDGVKSGKHLFYAGQILYSKIRPYLSKVVIAYFNGLCSADMYPINAKEDTKYLWYYMLSDEFLEQASNAGSRSVLPKINQKELSKIIVQMTSLKEQQVIVKFLDDIFAKEQQAKEAAEAVLGQIDAMKKVILARAFRGELGTNDPAEEWAGELVKKLFGEET